MRAASARALVAASKNAWWREQFIRFSDDSLPTRVLDRLRRRAALTDVACPSAEGRELR
jgi:hypothetical protein